MLTRRLPVFLELAKGNTIEVVPDTSLNCSQAMVSSKASPLTSEVAVYTFGDSQGEVLDYVFYGDPRYRTWSDRRVGWRSGWSARGLYMENNLQRILVPVSRCQASNAVVFLTFGSTDIDINLAYKRHVKGQTDLDRNRFMEEMTTNLWNAVLRLRDMHGDPAIAANLHVCLVFPYVPLPTTKAYWHEAFGNDPTPHSERVEMYALFIKRVCERGKQERGIDINILGATKTPRIKVSSKAFTVHILDVRDDFDRAGGFKAFQRRTVIDGKSVVTPDHHPDYIATQTIVADKIRGMNVGLDVCPPLKRILPHEERDMHTYTVIHRKEFYRPKDKSKAGKHRHG
eukprot:g8019.t1